MSQDLCLFQKAFIWLTKIQKHPWQASYDIRPRGMPKHLQFPLIHKRHKPRLDGRLANIQLAQCGVCTEKKGCKNLVLCLQEGKVAGRTKEKGCRDLADGAEIVLGNWEMDIDSRLDEAVFK